jgi:cobalt-zinc-cadmium efflux system membrane fusion protein
MTRVLKIVLCLAIVAAAAACSREAEQPAPEEPPTLDVTHWTERTELFMEYPPLVAGQKPIFAVHLTRLSDFSAMTTGRPRVEMTPEGGGAPTVLQGNPPSRPGVFRVEDTIPAPGRYTWALIVDAPDLQDRHELGTVTVFADEATAVADAEKNASGDPIAITYLKEPQWTNGFGTALVQEAEIRRAIRVPAVIQPVTGGEAVVSAPIDGRFMSSSLPAIGARVQAGQDLGRIQPRAGADTVDRASLVAAVAEAQAAVDAARAEVARSERLLAERAVPGRRVEDARRAAAVADARLEAAQTRLTQRDEALRTGGGTAGGNAFVLRAPIAGIVAEVFAALGASFDEGAPLFRIVRTDEVELQAHVPAADAPLDASVTEIALEIPGRADPLPVRFDHMHFAGILDPRTRALPVQFDIDNRGGQLLIGQTATAILYTGRRERMPAVPKDAVLMEAGRPYVFVQTGGESFSRRYIELAARDGDRVGIRSGLRPGERVVTKGAYDVQLASAASGLPAEGHVH